MFDSLTGDRLAQLPEEPLDQYWKRRLEFDGLSHGHVVARLLDLHLAAARDAQYVAHTFIDANSGRAFLVRSALHARRRLALAALPLLRARSELIARGFSTDLVERIEALGASLDLGDPTRRERSVVGASADGSVGDARGEKRDHRGQDAGLEALAVWVRTAYAAAPRTQPRPRRGRLRGGDRVAVNRCSLRSPRRRREGEAATEAA